MPPAPSPTAVSASTARPRAGLRRPSIPLVTGTGTGRTTLSAFDAALRAGGVANFNLIRLSSVIPPRAVIDAAGTTALPAGGWGDRLYCVYADARAAVRGQEAWAGVGWVQRLDGAGGLFVEHEGHSRTEVAEAIEASLADLGAGRPEEFGEPRMRLAGATCHGDPVCALVLAAYETAGWGFTR